jgi:hypothetical protein
MNDLHREITDDRSRPAAVRTRGSALLAKVMPGEEEPREALGRWGFRAVMGA